jgi:hypothetical protein
MSANDKQVGGGHYKNANGLPDHWDIVVGMGWDYLLGNATKYLWRLGRKGGPEKAIEDLDKAMHYLAKKRELLVIEASKAAEQADYKSRFHGGDVPFATLNEVLRRQISDDGFTTGTVAQWEMDFAAEADRRYTNQG